MTTRNLLTVREITDRLGIARSTFYTIRWFRDRAIYVRPRAPRWDPADVDLYEALHRGKAA
jgi:predicted DNA-binding transcriptional regulator AlpA